MAMSDYLEEQLMKEVYAGGTYTAPTAWYLALYNSSPGDDDTGTEITGGDYAPTTFTPEVHSSGSSPDIVWEVSNNADIVFPIATTDWTTINFVAIFDGPDTATANMLDWGAITTPRTVLTDGIFKVLTGELDIRYT